MPRPPSLVGLFLAIAACASDTASSPTPSGTVIVRVVPSGSAPIRTFRLLLDDSLQATSGTSDSTLIKGVSPGLHTVLVDSPDPRCVPDWYVGQPVTVEANKAALALFAIQCDSTRPGLVFASGRDNVRRNLYRMKADGSEVQRLTTHSLGDDHPAVSPGGTRIAFERNVAVGLPQIWLMNADGTNPSKLTDSGQLEQSPQWAPDSRHVVFIRWTTSDLRSIIIATPDGRSESTLLEGRISDGTASGTPLWSPDGTQIVVTISRGSRSGFRLVPVHGGAVTDYFPTDTQFSAFPKAWTPDGRLLLCRIQLPSGPCGLRLVGSEGAEGEVLVDSLRGLELPGSAAYSPDGATLAMTYAGPGAVGGLDIVIMQAAGGAIVDLTSSTTGHDLSPSWIP